MRKFIYLLISILFLTGCNHNINIQTNYNSVKLEITNTMMAGCHSNDDITYFSHNIQDKHTYIFEYENKLEYIKTDHWVVYNTEKGQYISTDFGTSFLNLDELPNNFFEKNYRDDFLKLLTFISNSKFTDIDSSGNRRIFSVDFQGQEVEVFNILKKFGTINSKEQLKKITTKVTVEDKNITKVLFEISSMDSDSKICSCYNVEWLMSDFNHSAIVLPDAIKG